MRQPVIASEAKQSIWIAALRCALLAMTGILILLPACGFEPVYGTSSSTASLPVSVDPVPGRIGQLFTTRLDDILNPGGQVPSRYALSVTLVHNETPTVIDPDGTIRRFQVTIDSSYRLTRKADGRQVLSGTARRLASYNVPQSDFATFIAQRDALERVLRELAEDYRLKLIAWYAAQKGNSS